MNNEDSQQTAAHRPRKRVGCAEMEYLEKIDEANNMKTKFIKLGLILLGLILFIVGQIPLAFAQPTLVEPAFEVPISKLPLKTFDSKNHNFRAIVCPDGKNTFIFKVSWRGNIGMREKIPMWSIKACFEEVWVANDGQHIIGATYAEGTLPSNYTKEEIIFSFFKNGKSIGDIGLSEIISDFSKLEKTQSGLRWGNMKGYNEAGYLVAETVENQILMLDPTTGTKVEFRQEKGKVPSGFKTYRDFMNCFTTLNNLKALEIYLTVVKEFWTLYEDGQEEKESDIEIEKSQEGPIYAVSLSKPGDPYKVLLLKLTDEGKHSQKEKETLKHITNTIKILK